MNTNIVKDLEAKASTAGLWENCPIATLERRTNKFDELMGTLPENTLREALDNQEVFEKHILEPVFAS